MITEFPAWQWKWRALYYLVRIIDSTGSVERLPGSGRRRSVRSDSNIQLVNDLICSQEGQPGTRAGGRSREIRVFRILLLWGLRRMICNSVFRRREVQSLTNWNDWMHANVWRNVWHGTRLAVLGSRMKRFLQSRRLLTARTIVYTPVWKQNVKCRQVDSETMETFHKERHGVRSCVKAPENISRLWGVRGQGKQCILLWSFSEKWLITSIRRLSGNNFTFQQDGAPSHRSKHTVSFLQKNVPDFTEPPN